ncbi:Enamine deaminase RidA, house cleaning of reactive enamine intermediates, YjgF/YER057c/UK114 family [Variovorax sp. CF079]|uniref:RidA family protein n=1 Tax=Variovorax sp. CF079 TaxID=1882774 RepID=UPI0008871AB2|nr:RidA family protein [Variovorax sp. CF079]SDE96420.1 Enamine deaminase RidA, house cleaning of reactive enamine intermediates, YjgF/YER057c/UK114 family [Variovorax sp. CF079]
MRLGERDAKAIELAAMVGLDLTSAPIPGGAYSPAVLDGSMAYLSGQIPKIGGRVASLGPVGSEVTPAQAKEAAKVCALRLLGVLMTTFGSLDAVESVVRLNVFVQSAPGFDRHSEVADGASELLAKVLQCEKGHARTAVGVLSLPKNASVEIDMTVAVKQDWPGKS